MEIRRLETLVISWETVAKMDVTADQNKVMTGK